MVVSLPATSHAPPPDGYTLFMAVDTNLVVNPALYPDLSYDPYRDFTPISVLTKTALVLVANPKVTANNVSELIAYAKAETSDVGIVRDADRWIA